MLKILVITIIVMLILAGVSLNAIVGDNGILTQAQQASIASKKASILENLDTELASYNVDTIIGNSFEATTILNNLINKKLIDSILCSGGIYKANVDSAIGIPNFDSDENYTGYIDYSVKKDDFQILLSVNDEGIYKAEFGEVNISAGGEVSGGTTLVTKDAFEKGDESANPEDKGKFTIDKDSSVMFVDEIGDNGEELSIYIKSGVHAKVKIFKNMLLTNSGMLRSAIDIEPGGTLDLWVADNVTLNVNSGFGIKGETGINGTMRQNKGGDGAYAGIHCWDDGNKKSILNISGQGTVICYGGDASDGGAAASSSETQSSSGCGGGGGRRSWSRNRTEMVEMVGDSNSISDNSGKNGYTNPLSTTNDMNAGLDGGKGEDCGIVNIYSSVTVYAYGGAGGSSPTSLNFGTNSGAGGYPAAGIGGGGAGRRRWRLGCWSGWIYRLCWR